MNRLTKVVGSNNHHMLFTYDEFGRINMMSNTINGTSNQNEYVYGDKNVVGEIPGLIYNVKLNGTTQLSYEFDQLARLSTRTLGTTTPFTTTYTYLDGAGTNSTTTLLGSMQNGINDAFNYTYDANGNILTISEGTLPKATYTYDKMNQLISENNAYTSKSIDYVYDIGGNIISRTEYNYINGSRESLIDTYNYGYSTSWKDQLISYDGQSITYDEVGNPLTYRDNLSFTWANGRELTSVANNGISGSYTYNDSGIRTSKTYDGVTTNYFLNGYSIVRQVTGSKILDFFYDENGNLYGFKDDGDMYYYVRNGQSDIIGILDNTGVQVVYYQYDSWGNPLTPTGSSASTIGADNPFRYRGYYLDSETGLYYLNSRYYDSTVGRFINADNQINNNSIIGPNLYSYCYNNPIALYDNDGNEPLTLLIVGVYFFATTIFVLMTTYTISNPSFQRTWNQMCSNFANNINYGIHQLGTAINWASIQMNNIAQSIGKSFSQAIRILTSSWQKHHLVAKNAPNATYAAKILNEVLPLGTEDPMNLLLIKPGLHSRLHTNAYYGWANSVVISAYNSANGNKILQRVNVYVALGVIKEFVSTMNAVAPF